MSLQNQLDEIIFGIPTGETDDYPARRQEDIQSVRDGLKMADAYKALIRSFQIKAEKSPVSHGYFIEIRSSDGKASLIAKTDKDGAFAIEEANKTIASKAKGGSK